MLDVVLGGDRKKEEEENPKAIILHWRYWESSFRGSSNTCNRSSVFQPIHLHCEVVLQKKEPNNGKQVDKDESQDCS